MVALSVFSLAPQVAATAAVPLQLHHTAAEGERRLLLHSCLQEQMSFPSSLWVVWGACGGGCSAVATVNGNVPLD